MCYLTVYLICYIYALSLLQLDADKILTFNLFQSLI